MRNHITFRQILAQTADASSKRLVERARVASSVAKVARGLASRRAAYAVKRAALEHGVARFAPEFSLSGMEEEGRLLRVRYRHEASFHLPVARCGAATLAWVRSERAEVARVYRRDQAA